MSNDYPKHIGEARPFETEGRSYSVAESRKHQVSIVGRYADLVNLNLDVGDKAPSCVEDGASLFIENFQISKENDTGTMNLSLVKVPSQNKPYHYTVTIDMQEVSKKIINHPRMKSKTTQEQIRRWEKTEDNLRVDWSTGTPVFMMWVDAKGDGLSAGERVDDEWAIKYCKASIMGVDTYNVYLPVIEQQTSYIKLPGTKTDKDTRKITGTLNPDDADKIGTFDTPPVTLAGYIDGKWLKTVDRFNQNANGSWSRTEQWTYTNDLRFTWIYDDKASTQVIEDDD